MTTQLHNTPEISAALKREGLDALLAQIAARLDALRENQPLSAFDMTGTSALPDMCRIFGLSDAEAELIALTVGCEINDMLTTKVADLNGTGAVDVALALRMFGRFTWDILCPEAPLRHWHLVELVGRGPLRQRSIQVDERIVQAMLGVSYIDERLCGLIDRVTPDPQSGSPDGVSEIVNGISHAWTNGGMLPLVLLGGQDRTAQRNVVARVSQKFDLQVFRLHASDVPTEWHQRNTLARHLDRELALSGAALIIESTLKESSAAATMAEALTGPTFLIADDPPLVERAPRLRFDLEQPTTGARRAVWGTALGTQADALGPMVDHLASQFSLEPTTIQTVVLTACEPHRTTEELSDALWREARIQGRRALNGLAQRVNSTASWEDLILPASLMRTLKDITSQVRHAWRVNEEWGWEQKSPRGLGTAALFAGPSGTGKTLAAEVIANDLSLDLYRIDLSQVVSKYIGETEKNLSRIFEAAENSGAVLLFDEADALFGKRSEVKDSHDRYANVEVSYLLQKMEGYRGLAILTSNQKSALDTAFLRRLRYVLSFPFPDTAARLDIWRQVFPEQTPLDQIDFAKLANLSISGGSIRSIALNASYLAAGAHHAVSMEHIRSAAFREYAKVEKPVTTTEKAIFS